MDNYNNKATILSFLGKLFFREDCSCNCAFGNWQRENNSVVTVPRTPIARVNTLFACNDDKRKVKRYGKEHEGQNQSWEAGMNFAQAKYSDQPRAQGRGKDDRELVPMSAAFSGW